MKIEGMLSNSTVFPGKKPEKLVKENKDSETTRAVDPESGSQGRHQWERQSSKHQKEEMATEEQENLSPQPAEEAGTGGINVVA